MTYDLFGGPAAGEREFMGEQAFILRGFALPFEQNLLEAVATIHQQAPFRHMTTPNGHRMAAALTNCGPLGWITDEHGYRYSAIDPITGQAWPAMPRVFQQLAHEAAQEAGFAHFKPDAGLINRYAPQTGMGLHQDKNERDHAAPIVSVSLGMTAIFLFGGFHRSDKTQKFGLFHGDVAVWGGVDRMRFHGIHPLQDTPHPTMGRCRINITLRHTGF